MGRFLRGLIRDADYIGKYSDNEIGVILPETNSSGANIVLNRVHESTGRLRKTVSDNWDEIVPELAIAMANFPKDAGNLEELVNIIDSRYKALGA
ncbi:MAG: diguanylate cyclase [Deltaproteobacteria bacterium]|nr:diguanylate cyclase [Deltaproteobacteria bacterium]